MKEIRDIITAYEENTAAGIPCVLATVVHVVGSSYRRPGARMLVTESGVLTGAISGGCLEGDALRKAMMALHENQNKLVTYDTTDDEDQVFGVQLGCNGIVHILFEPINKTDKYNPIEILKLLLSERRTTILATFFSLTDKNNQIGTSAVFYPSDSVFVAENKKASVSLLNEYVTSVLSNEKSMVEDFPQNSFTALIEYVPPPIALYIFGAGNDAQPLVNMANILGWETTVIDGRMTHATSFRFPLAKRVLVAKPLLAVRSIETDERTVCLLMTHNYNYDIEALKHLLQSACVYIGVLGPKKKMDKMFAELQQQGVTITPADLARVYSPVGLDIGAETSEEIALSMLAEIKAVISKRTAIMLRDKLQPIHF